jgi:peptidoglycan/xylan/chitin deacetylase (PgdA/CDA1 family)
LILAAFQVTPQRVMFVVTLSFDNGPEPDVTPGVLDVLRRRGIRASFFVVGSKLCMPSRRGIAERASAEGHWIGNHTFSHSVPLGLCEDPNAPEAEIGRTQELIGDLASPQCWFRPFGRGGELGTHLLSRAALDYLSAARFTCVLWNAVPHDWEDPQGWVERALAQCRALSWALLVLHDLSAEAMAHLDHFVGAVLDEGGGFRQDYPPDLVPIRSGQIVLPLDGILGGP